MDRRVVRLAIVGTVSLLAHGEAIAQPRPGAIFIRMSASVGPMPMSDLDGYVQKNVTSIVGPVSPASPVFATEGIGTGTGPIAEVGYMVAPQWSVGLAATGSGDEESQTFGSIFFDGGTNSLSAHITDVTANATFWIPRGEGLFLGAEAGTGWGSLSEDFNYANTLNGTVLEYNGHWKKTGLVGGVFAGWQPRFPIGLLVLARVGYKYRNLGVMPGDKTVTASTFAAYPVGTTNGPIQDPSGRALESDFSQLSFGIGLGWEFGGRREHRSNSIR